MCRVLSLTNLKEIENLFARMEPTNLAGDTLTPSLHSEEIVVDDSLSELESEGELAVIDEVALGEFVPFSSSEVPVPLVAVARRRPAARPRGSLRRSGCGATSLSWGSCELEGQRDPKTGRWRIHADALCDYMDRRGPRAPRRRLEDHPRFQELEAEVGCLWERLSRFEVRLGIMEGLLQELRATLLRSMCDGEAEGASSERED